VSSFTANSTKPSGGNPLASDGFGKGRPGDHSGAVPTQSDQRKIRALVVDDSVVIRRLVADTLSADPHIDVVGVAANGRIALSKIPQVQPHVVILDIEMPEMDGLETLREIRAHFPSVKVIMFSTLTERGAQATLDALSLGASDYATKASNTGSIGASTRALQEELIPKVKALFAVVQAAPVQISPIRRDVASSMLAPPRGRLQKPELVVIGVSTGGPNALGELVPMIPENFPLPILIVQHMPPMFTRLLADRLHALTPLTVKEAEHGDVVQNSGIWIAPGNFHMRVSRRDGKFLLSLDQGEMENSCRPAVDVLFRSADECCGGAVIAVVLTGMGQDGLRGATQLKASGARVLAQDEASSVVWGMPGYVAKAGIADRILPLPRIMPAVLELLESR